MCSIPCSTPAASSPIWLVRALVYPERRHAARRRSRASVRNEQCDRPLESSAKRASEDEARFVYAESAPSFGRRLRQLPQDHEFGKRWHATRQPRLLHRRKPACRPSPVRDEMRGTRRHRRGARGCRGTRRRSGRPTLPLAPFRASSRDAVPEAPSANECDTRALVQLDERHVSRACAATVVHDRDRRYRRGRLRGHEASLAERIPCGIGAIDAAPPTAARRRRRCQKRRHAVANEGAAQSDAQLIEVADVAPFTHPACRPCLLNCCVGPDQSSIFRVTRAPERLAGTPRASPGPLGGLAGVPSRREPGK